MEFVTILMEAVMKENGRMIREKASYYEEEVSSGEASGLEF
jgi:hypothetical protein